MSEILKLENVTKMYEDGVRAINDISFSVEKDEHTFICGVPGSGKRTLMRMIAGMDTASSGSINVLNEDVNRMNENESSTFRNRNIGAILKEPGLMERLNVLENIALPLVVRRVPRALRRQQAKEQLVALGIKHIAHAYPMHLSKYQAIMVSIARALITQPMILLIYDITVGLSEKESADINGVINVLSKYSDQTIIGFSSNDDDMPFAHKRIRLNRGRIQEDRS